MDLEIRGKTALICAASRGFGKATALRLAAEGVKVAMCARGRETLDEAAGEAAVLAAGGARDVLARAVDVTDAGAMRNFVNETEQVLGPIDLLLVNAGGPPAGRFADLDSDQWDAAYRLNLASAVDLCRLVMPGMMERGWGRIVQVTSVSVKQPVENLMLSSVIRPAAHALARWLAVEAAPRGVTVNSVAPGFHTTSAVERLIARKMEDTGCTREDVIAGWTRDIPLGRLGDPDELAALIVFLMSGPAGYITGQCIASDGGWVKGTF
ncbi:MAG: SDR family oxidoreductase [bacterium]|nr:SDR family oxidoreductase [bacterium]